MGVATKVKKTIKHICAACKKRIDPEFAVETEVGLKHQSCFRNGL